MREHIGLSYQLTPTIHEVSWGSGIDYMYCFDFYLLVQKRTRVISFQIIIWSNLPFVLPSVYYKPSVQNTRERMLLIRVKTDVKNLTDSSMLGIFLVLVSSCVELDSLSKSPRLR